MPEPSAHSLLLKKENAHDDAIYCCAWVKTNTTEDPKAPLKDFIVTGGLDGVVRVWLFENNKLELVHSLAEHPMAVLSVAVSPDGHTIASTCMGSTLVIWDLVSGNKVHKIESNGIDVWKVAFSPDGTQVVTASHTGKLGVFGIEKGTLDKVLDTRGKFDLSVAWSPDGKFIAAGSTDGVVYTYNVVLDKLRYNIPAHDQDVNSVAFTPNSQLVLSASPDGTVCICNVAKGIVQLSTKYTSRVMTAAVSSDGSRAAIAGADGSVRVALLDKLEQIHLFEEHTGPVCGLQFNAGGDKLLSVSKDKSINIYECPVPPKPVVKQQPDNTSTTT